MTINLIRRILRDFGFDMKQKDFCDIFALLQGEEFLICQESKTNIGVSL